MLVKAKLKWLASEWSTSQAEVISLGIDILFDLTKEKIIFYDKKGKFVLTRNPTRADIIRQLIEKENPRMSKLKLKAKGKTEDEEAILKEAVTLEDDVEGPGENPLDLAALLSALDGIDESNALPGELPETEASSTYTQEFDFGAVLAPIESKIDLLQGTLTSLMEKFSLVAKSQDEVTDRVIDLDKSVQTLTAKVTELQSIPPAATPPVTEALPLDPKPATTAEPQTKVKSENDLKKEQAIITYLKTSLKTKKQLGPLATSLAERLGMEVDVVKEIIVNNAPITGTKAKWVSPAN